MKIITCIASTTHLDYDHERMAKSALDGSAQQIRSKFIPFLVNHDRSKQIGVLLFGKVARLNDGEFALYVVCGIFENQDEANSYKIGSPNYVWKDYQDDLEHIKDATRDVIPNKKHKNTKVRPNNLNPAQLLERHLDSTKVLPDGTVYKVKFLIASTGDLQIHLYPKDHDPKHFHVISKQRGLNGRFDINTLELLSSKKGEIRRRDVRKIQSFFELHPNILKRLKNEHRRLSS